MGETANGRNGDTAMRRRARVDVVDLVDTVDLVDALLVGGCACAVAASRRRRFAHSPYRPFAALRS